MNNMVQKTIHRPTPLPKKPWVMTQMLRDVFFMHWPVEMDTIKGLLPESLEPDMYEGMAWVSIVPFRVEPMRMRGLPPIPGLNSYLELNVRTYVIHRHIPGIFFLNIHTDKLPIILGARLLTGLPYSKRNMKYQMENESFIFHSGSDFKATLNVNPDRGFEERDPLKTWLVERYSMFSVKNKGLYRGDIHHLPWQIWHATGSIEQNTLLPIKTEQNPIIHFAPRQPMLIYPLTRIG